VQAFQIKVSLNIIECVCVNWTHLAQDGSTIAILRTLNGYPSFKEIRRFNVHGSVHRNNILVYNCSRVRAS